MVYTIHPVKPTDSPGLADTMMGAFYQDAHWASPWKGVTLDKIIYDCAMRLPWNLVKATSARRHRKAVDDVTGSIVGYARWVILNGCTDEWVDRMVLETDPEQRQVYQKAFGDVTENGKIRGIDHEMLDELSEAIETAEAKVLSSGEEFLALGYLATHPDHQRRGIGSMLLSEGLAYADRNSLKTIVIAKTPGVRLYEDHGFHIVEIIQ